MDAADFVITFQDHLAPKLDMYEQAIYLYIFRHGRLLGHDEVVIGFKSARKKMAFGIGKMGRAPSEASVYEKVKSLQAKGCLSIEGSEKAGTRIRLLLPREMPGVVPAFAKEMPPQLEEMDFFEVPENRNAILRREEFRCFYCLRAITEKNFVIEHVVSRPEGNNGYRNVVAACRGCNNRKGSSPVEDFLRDLYREGLLDPGEFAARMEMVKRLRAGDLRPAVHSL